MVWLAEFAIVNVLVTLPVAVLLFALSRWLKRPALIHALWVLLLIKLVTPAPFELDLGYHVANFEVDESTEIAALVDEPSIASAQDDVVGSEQTAEADAEATAFSFAPSPAVAPLSPSRATSSNANVGTNWLASFFNVTTLFIIWAVGAAVWFVVQGTRIGWFVWSLRHAELADTATQQQCERLARSMGIRWAPRVWVVPNSVSPMLWAFASPAKLLFPRELLERLDENARGTLLTHELAHLRRYDHVVRLLEFVVTGLYWWNPVVWLARRQIEVAEEHCCDAWVVDQFADQPRCYAEALLDTIDFLCEAPRTVPPAASGIGDASFLRKRLTMIMRESLPKRMSWRGRCAYGLVALMLLPLNPMLFGSVERLATLSELEAPPGESITPSVVTGTTIDEESSVNSTDQEQARQVDAAQAWATAFSPDRSMKITAYTTQQVTMTSLPANVDVDLTADRVTSAAFDPEGTLVVTGCTDGRLIFRDAMGQAIEAFTAHTSAVRSICFAPDGSYFVSADRNGGVIIWDAKSRSRLIGFDTTPDLNCVRISRDGRQLAVASGNWRFLKSGRVTLWGVATGEKSPLEVDDMRAVGAIAFTGNQLVTADWDGQLMTIEMATGVVSSTGQIAKERVSANRFCADCDDITVVR